MNYFYDTLAPYGGWVNFARLRLVLAANDCRLQHRLATVLRQRTLGLYRLWLVLGFGLFLGLGDISLRSLVSSISAMAGAGARIQPGRHPGCSGVMIKITVAGRHCRLLRFINLASDLFTRATRRVPVCGLNANAFTFVATKDFCDPHPRRHRIQAGEVTRIFNQTTVINNISFDSHHQGIVNAGIPPHDITAVTRQEIHPVTIQAGNGNVAWGGRHEQFERNAQHPGCESSAFCRHSGSVGASGNFADNSTRAKGISADRSREWKQRASAPVNPGQNNSPHQNINQNPYQNFNQTPPRMPQTQQPGVQHVNPL